MRNAFQFGTEFQTLTIQTKPVKLNEADKLVREADCHDVGHKS